MSDKIESLDAIMSSGKTYAIIDWMKKNPNNKYLYVSPMLKEVEERLPDEAASLEFTFPTTENHNTKGEHLLDLLSAGRNISFTHSLFTDLSLKHLALIKKHEYVLIIDEEVTLIEPYQGRYSKGDITSLEEANHIKVHDEDLGRVEWLWEDMDDNTQYSQLRRLCSMEMLYCSKRSRDMMVIHLPIALVQSASRTIIISYLFSGSVMEAFLKLKGMDVVPFTEVVLRKNSYQVKQEAKQLIDFCSLPSMSKLSNYSMSSTWYSTNAKQEQLQDVGSVIRNICHKEGRENIIMTMPKESTLKLTKKGKPNPRYALHKNVNPDDIYLYCGARATNAYKDKTVCIHAYNRYINMVVKSYLQDYGTEIGCVPTDDQFALSECIQWIWRTCIREDKPVKVYILSTRMKNLLSDWLDGKIP